jgi:hypothetical protein
MELDFLLSPHFNLPFRDVAYGPIRKDVDQIVQPDGTENQIHAGREESVALPADQVPAGSRSRPEGDSGIAASKPRHRFLAPQGLTDTSVRQTGGTSDDPTDTALGRRSNAVRRLRSCLPVLELKRVEAPIWRPRERGRPRNGPRAHDGSITTEGPDTRWGTDTTIALGELRFGSESAAG